MDRSCLTGAFHLGNLEAIPATLNLLSPSILWKNIFFFLTNKGQVLGFLHTKLKLCYINTSKYKITAYNITFLKSNCYKFVRIWTFEFSNTEGRMVKEE